MWEWLNSDMRMLTNGTGILLLGLWFYTARQSDKRTNELQTEIKELAWQMRQQQETNNETDGRLNRIWDELTSDSTSYDEY